MVYLNVVKNQERMNPKRGGPCNSVEPLLLEYRAAIMPYKESVNSLSGFTTKSCSFVNTLPRSTCDVWITTPMYACPFRVHVNLYSLGGSESRIHPNIQISMKCL